MSGDSRRVHHREFSRLPMASFAAAPALPDVKSVTEFETIAARGKLVAFFWAAWHEPSKPGGQMDQVCVSEPTCARPRSR